MITIDINIQKTEFSLPISLFFDFGIVAALSANNKKKRLNFSSDFLYNR